MYNTNNSNTLTLILIPEGGKRIANKWLTQIYIPQKVDFKMFSAFEMEHYLFSAHFISMGSSGFMGGG